jgi:hypothetical protein
MPLVDSFGFTGRVIDQLRFEEAVGEGGFSLVYRGRHTGLDEPVAIKCLKLPQALDAELVEQFIGRFRAECKLCYRLSQGTLGIVRSITSGTTYSPAGSLVPYMALEWLEGCSLGSELRSRAERGEPPPTLEEAITMLEPAVQAIAYAHSQGIVHRDIKPGNLFVMRTRDGLRMKVLDFGLAKILHDESVGVRPSVKTTGNFFFASPSYGAPEQFDPRLGGIGPWTDVYALALLLMEMVTGRKVRHAATMADAVLRALDPKSDLSPRGVGMEASAAVNDVLARATAIEPQRRPPNAGALWAELRDAMLDVPSAGMLGKTIADNALPARLVLEQALAKQAAATSAAPAATRREGQGAAPDAAPAAAPPSMKTLRLDQVIPLPAALPNAHASSGRQAAAPPGQSPATVPLAWPARPPEHGAPHPAVPVPAPGGSAPRLPPPSDPRLAADASGGAYPVSSGDARRLARSAATPRKRSVWPVLLLVMLALAVFAGGAWLGFTLLGHPHVSLPAR